jgi:hypothetical protein
MLRSYSILIVSIILASCNQLNSGAKKPVVKEDFKSFANEFYSDSIFQQNRIASPLQGEILEWDNMADTVIISNWMGRESIVSDYTSILDSYGNAQREYKETQDSIVEKIYIENSGFLLERTFKLLNGEWYLVRYNISNL